MIRHETPRTFLRLFLLNGGVAEKKKTKADDETTDLVIRRTIRREWERSE